MPMFVASLMTNPRATDRPCGPARSSRRSAGGAATSRCSQRDQAVPGRACRLVRDRAPRLPRQASCAGTTTPPSRGRGRKAVAGSWALTAPVMAFLAGGATGTSVVRCWGTGPPGGDGGRAAYLDRTCRVGATADCGGRRTVHALGLDARFPQVRDDRPAAELETAVMATYTAAQFLLSEGAARA